MAFDIKTLLTKYRIHWRDRGANVSHGNLVINCPFCAQTSNPDHGEHLAVSPIGEYFCFRNPAHKGRNLVRLFRLLNIPAHEYSHLQFSYHDVPITPKEKKNFSLIRCFQKGEDSQEVIEYLKGRNFSQPSVVCHKFGLLTDKEGKWAGRLIIPLTVGWTGRAMRSHIEPRYSAYTTEDGFFLHKQGNSSCVIVEGAIDAMRVATVSSQFDVVAKCGNRLSAALLNYLQASKYLTIWNAPDGDVDFTQFFQETKTLASYCTSSTVKRFQLPEEFSEYKDFGEMHESQARHILGLFQ